MLTLEFLGWTVVKLVVLAITLFVVWKGVAAMTSGDLNNAIFNAEILRAAINDACNDEDSAIDSLSLTQPRPTKFSGLATILPRYSINTAGDPNYVLYYELFPPGEATGWELYSSHPYRIITPYIYPDRKLENTNGKLKGQNAVEFMKALDQHVSQVSQEFLNKAEQKDLKVTVPPEIFVNNIVLSDSLNVFPDKDPKKPALGKDEGLGDLGKWETPEVPDKDGAPGNKGKMNNRFKFNNIVLQSLLERSLIKYRPCGDNALCMKTKDNVYKFPLDKSCKDINRIELVYDLTAQEEVRDIMEATFGTNFVITAYDNIAGKNVASKTSLKKNLLAILKGMPLIGLIFTGFESADVPDALVSLILTYKSSDFYLASPCKIPGKIEVKKVACNSDFDSCKREVSYPMYAYTGGDSPVVTYEGEHAKCVENIGDALDPVKDPSLEPQGDKCIQIKVTQERPKDYCWTAEPFKEWDFGENTITRLVAATLELEPVKGNTAFLKDSKSIVLYPSQETELKFGDILKFSGERWGWGWPGGGIVKPV